MLAETFCNQILVHIINILRCDRQSCTLLLLIFTTVQMKLRNGFIFTNLILFTMVLLTIFFGCY